MRRVLLNQFGLFIFIMVISSKQGKPSTSRTQECNPALHGINSAECLSSHSNVYGREPLKPDFQGMKCQVPIGKSKKSRLFVFAPEADGVRLPSSRRSLLTQLHFLLARIQLLLLNKKPSALRLGFSNLIDSWAEPIFSRYGSRKYKICLIMSGKTWKQI